MKKNRIRLNESQLRQIIKESVKYVLRESNYDNYEYFYPDGTGGTDVSTYPYSSDIGRLENDGNREDQMDYDWEQLGYPPKIGTERRGKKDYDDYVTQLLGTMHDGNNNIYTDDELRRLNPNAIEDKEMQMYKDWDEHDALNESIRRAIRKVLH